MAKMIRGKAVKGHKDVVRDVLVLEASDEVVQKVASAMKLPADGIAEAMSKGLQQYSADQALLAAGIVKETVPGASKYEVDEVSL